MKKLLTALCAATLLLSACQKEPSFQDPNSLPGGGTAPGNSGRLVRIGSRVGTDTVTTNYSYNSANRLTVFQQTGLVSGMNFTAEVRYVRNATNIITSSIIKNDALSQFGLDSIESFHFYDQANARYKHSITPITYQGQTEKDSVVFVYSAGKLTTAIDYYNDGSGIGYVPYSKEEYVYNGANVSQIKSYSFNGISYDLDETLSYEYDSKINPMQATADAPITSMRLFYSANNYTKSTSVQTNPAGTDVVTVAYTYNTSNKPLTAISTSGGTTSTNTYYYQ